MPNLTVLIDKWENSALEFREAEALINLLVIDNNRLEEKTTTKQARKVIANETIRKIIEDSHMAGQADSGIDPSYSNAQRYCDDLFEA